jgi:hypothetical protein
MQGHFWRKLIYSGLSIIIAPVILAAATPAGNAAPSSANSNSYEYTNEAAHFLNQMRADALHLRENAENLEAQNREELDWRSDAYLVNRMSNRIGQMDRIMYSLQNIRKESDPWQQRTITRIAPQVAVISSTMNGTLNYLNSNHNRLWTTDWQGYAHDLYNSANHLTRTLRTSKEYARMNALADSNMKSAS